MHALFLAGVAAFILYMLLDLTGLADSGCTEAIASFALGLDFGLMIVGVLYTSLSISKIRAFKMRLLQKR